MPIPTKRWKAKATSDDEEEDSDEESDDGEELEVEEFVLCTLDPEKVCAFAFHY
jgi:FK506-binding nuclear protein